MGHRLVQRPETGQRGGRVLGALRQMLVQPPVRRLPGLGPVLAKLRAEVLAHERMGVERGLRIDSGGIIGVNGDEAALAEVREGAVPIVVIEADQRLCEALNGRFVGVAERREAARIGRAVEQTQQLQDGQLPLALLARIAQPFPVGRQHAEGVATLGPGIGLLKTDETTLTHITVIALRQPPPEQLERERVTGDLAGGVFQFLVVRLDWGIARLVDACVEEQLGSGLVGEVLQGPLRRRRGRWRRFQRASEPCFHIIQHLQFCHQTYIGPLDCHCNCQVPSCRDCTLSQRYRLPPSVLSCFGIAVA